MDSGFAFPFSREPWRRLLRPGLLSFTVAGTARALSIRPIIFSAETLAPDSLRTTFSCGHNRVAYAKERPKVRLATALFKNRLKSAAFSVPGKGRRCYLHWHASGFHAAENDKYIPIGPVVMPVHFLSPRRRIIFPALLILILQTSDARAFQGRPDTVIVNLREAVSYALAVSPEVGVVDSGRKFAEARLRFARANRYLTEFEATSAHSTAPALTNPNGTPTDELYLDPDVRNDWENLSAFNRIEVQLVQPLFTWGEIGGNIRAARFGVEVEEESVRSKELEIATRTAELYYSMLLTEELTRVIEDVGKIVERAIVEIENLIDEEDSDVDDADLFQVQIAEQEFMRKSVEVDQKRHTARAALSLQLFLPDGATATTASRLLTPIEVDLQRLKIYQEAGLVNRPEMGQVRAGLEARNALVSVAMSDYYPKLFVAVNATYGSASGRYRQRNPYVGDPFLSRSVRAGVGFRQNLNFAQTRSKVEQARADASEVRFQGEVARQLILFEVEEAYRNVLIARVALDTQNEALRLSKDWLRTEEISFDLQIGDTENLVRAVRANIELQVTHFQAVYDYNVSVLRLFRSTGTLPESLDNGTLVE